MVGVQIVDLSVFLCYYKHSFNNINSMVIYLYKKKGIITVDPEISSAHEEDQSCDAAIDSLEIANIEEVTLCNAEETVGAMFLTAKGHNFSFLLAANDLENVKEQIQSFGDGHVQFLQVPLTDVAMTAGRALKFLDQGKTSKDLLVALHNDKSSVPGKYINNYINIVGYMKLKLLMSKFKSFLGIESPGIFVRKYISCIAIG